MGTYLLLTLVALSMPVSDWSRIPGYSTVDSKVDRYDVGLAFNGYGTYTVPYIQGQFLTDSVTGSEISLPPQWHSDILILGTKQVPVPPGPGPNPFPYPDTNLPPVYHKVTIYAGQMAVTYLQFNRRTVKDAWTFDNGVDPSFSISRQGVFHQDPELKWERRSVAE